MRELKRDYRWHTDGVRAIFSLLQLGIMKLVLFMISTSVDIYLQPVCTPNLAKQLDPVKPILQQ